MSQTGFTPIQLYRTSTASAAPTAGNLAAGELAINDTDEKLYFKNAAGTVKLLAANVTPIANGGTAATTAAGARTALGAAASGANSDIVSLAGPITGITFAATQTPSADPNTLDDYEEGTWTPLLAFGGVTTGITYSSSGGYYTKIGRVVTLTGGFSLSSKGAATGEVTIGGLPFSNKVGPPYIDAGVSGTVGDSSSLTMASGAFLFLDHSASSLQMIKGTHTSFTDADFANNTTLYGIYITYSV